MIKEAEIFNALSNNTRLRILRVLISADAELCVCEITAILKLPQYNISKGLKVLKNAGMVSERREGKWMMYKINKNDEFNSALFESVRLIKCSSNPLLKNDLKNLEKKIKSGLLNKCFI